jgi:selenide,water dikinase
MDIKLTSFSHGAGCGCKISPAVLDTILKRNVALPNQEKLLVGNDSKDDAAVYDLGNGQALISTTDFFMPIVDDPYDFGAIASTNAISDVYAMGGVPILAIAILGWPINKIGAEVANEVIRGARDVCKKAGISLAGGHSIDSPEPIFGLAVNGLVDIQYLKKNSTSKVGDYLFLTKSLGIGILTTAEKKNLVSAEDIVIAKNSMSALNSIGSKLSMISGVNAMTDVTGFGLLGHLTEMCEGSGVSAEIEYSSVRFLTGNLDTYIEEGAIPGGTTRNLESYQHKISNITGIKRNLIKLADPQTSGGLLISVSKEGADEVIQLLKDNGLGNYIVPIGKIINRTEYSVAIH